MVKKEKKIRKTEKHKSKGDTKPRNYIAEKLLNIVDNKIVITHMHLHIVRR